MSRSQLGLLALGIALSAVAVYLLVRSIDLSEAMRALGRASPGWFVAAVLVTLFGYYLRTLRWREILSPHSRPTMGRLFSATMVGFLAINILPVRLGELVRAYALARSERISTTTVLGSVAVERILDLALLGIFWALSLPFAPLPAWFRWSGFLTIALGVCVGIILWALHSARGRTARRVESAVVRRLPVSIRNAVSTGLRAFGAGLQILGRPGRLAGVGLWSAAAWIVSGVVFLLVGESLGMRLPVWSLFLLTFVVCVGILVPSSPGFIGVLEGACVVGLSLLGHGGPEALAFGILYHLTQFLPVLVLGTYFAFREHLTPDLLRARRDPDESPGRKSRRQ